MARAFQFETAIQPDWIDYNGHMRDAYFGLVFSLAVDAMQDEVGFDEAYRKRTGCTIYLLEDHKYFLREVKLNERVRVESFVVNCDAKRFHLHMRMYAGGELASVGEFMELHVSQTPTPRAAPMPDAILVTLQAAKLSNAEVAALSHRPRPMGF